MKNVVTLQKILNTASLVAVVLLCAQPVRAMNQSDEEKKSVSRSPSPAAQEITAQEDAETRLLFGAQRPFDAIQALRGLRIGDASVAQNEEAAAGVSLDALKPDESGFVRPQGKRKGAPQDIKSRHHDGKKGCVRKG